MNIYIGNLHPSANEHQLKDLFKTFGKVLDVKIIMDFNTNQSKGFGFVEMDERVDGNSAIKDLNHSEFMAQQIEVSEARPNTTAQPNQNFSQQQGKKKR